ncbi:uncharacterized protein LOC135957155 [Calliphora vicina]|uniref:uncharacterized protein LOC135957155 n=1 Tax=Calliphora vicina TaxID=7373 RepID=UPI00325B5498
MRNTLVLLCLALACLCHTQAAVYRRGDKISENFKQLDLAPEEIDPNVAPLPPKIEGVDEITDDILNVNDNDNEIIDEAGENEIIDESANEIPQAESTVAPAVAVATTVAPVTVAEAVTPIKAEEEANGLAKYCKCNENYCDCCRNFNLPFIPVKGPGCARMTYLGNEKMSISLKYGDLTLASRTVSSKKSRPICVGLPGGYSQFCGRVYGLSKEKKAKESFKACLGFELRADEEVEAALRVSCFKFGPEGLRVAEAEPLPVETNKEEDDDDDDIFGFGAGGDDDEEDYDEDEEDDEEEEEADDDADTGADGETDYADDDAEEEAPVDADYGGFSLAGLLDELDDDEDEESNANSTPAIAPLSTLAPARNAVESKDDKGTVAVAAVESTETVAPVAAAATAVADEATSAPESMPDTTAKTKKSKKARKNKKKKAADAEGDFAYDIINGLLDFFN